MPTRRETLVGGAAAVVTAGGASVTRVGGGRRDGFLWGAATAAHQIEGNNTNSDYWVLEHIPDTYFRNPSGDACDSWNRWREDLALLKAGGLNAYRFSIEWARIEPERGAFSEATLHHYRRICAACRELGIEPVVTFHHFTSPRWIAGQGGFENPRTADAFARYAEHTAKALAGVAQWVCTTNEANGQAFMRAVAREKPWDKLAAVQAQAAKAIGADRFSAFFVGDAYKARDGLLDAHRKARDAIKSAIPGAKVGMTLDLQQLSAGPGGEDLFKHIWAEARTPFYEAARGDDFIGVQTYHTQRTGPDGLLPYDRTGMIDGFGRATPPTALAVVAEEAHRATGVPVLVSENGFVGNDDARRIQHMRGAVEALAERIDAGLPVLGYFHWSLLDNFEWSSGFAAHFGLVAVDRSTFRRTPKPSLAAYRELIAATRRGHRWA